MIITRFFTLKLKGCSFKFTQNMKTEFFRGLSLKNNLSDDLITHIKIYCFLVLTFPLCSSCWWSDSWLTLHRGTKTLMFILCKQAIKITLISSWDDCSQTGLPNISGCYLLNWGINNFSTKTFMFLEIRMRTKAKRNAIFPMCKLTSRMKLEATTMELKLTILLHTLLDHVAFYQHYFQP